MLQVNLKVVGGKHDGEIIPLHSPKFLIGREGDCHLRPNSDSISRHHCAFTLDDYGVRLRDLGSTNGTFVNGERVRGVVQLNSGDQVAVGKLTLEVELAEGDSPPPAPPAADQSTLTGETAELSADETSYEIPAFAPPPEAPPAESESAPTPPPAPPEPAPQPAPGQQPAPYPYQAPYPQQPGYYPPGPPMGYPPMGGYYPQYPQQPYPYPQPVVMQPMPQPGYAPQPPSQPATEADNADEVPDVRLPDPSTTGAKDDKGSGGNQAEGSPPPSEERNPSQHAADIIKSHLQRGPNVG